MNRSTHGAGTSEALIDSPRQKLVLIVAGEASADLHGSKLVKAMRELDPTILFQGIGGEELRRLGVQILFSSSQMAVMGLTEPLVRLWTILKAFRKLRSLLKTGRPNLLILMDYPEFNISLAGVAKRCGVPVLYYISPQVWAWRKRRVKKIADRTDRMAVILPFEERFYREKGIQVDFVGHPLLDAPLPSLNDQVIEKRIRVDLKHPVLALLPGSRRHEVKYHLPIMVAAAEILKTRYPEMELLLPLAPTISLRFIAPILADSKVEIRVLHNEMVGILDRCHAAIVASGTATLETAFMGIPMVIIYRMSSLSFWIGKMIIKVPWIGMVNLVAEEQIVPELIQNEVTPERLAEEAVNLLEDPSVRGSMIRKMKRVRERLGGSGASMRVARIAVEMMAGNG